MLLTTEKFIKNKGEENAKMLRVPFGHQIIGKCSLWIFLYLIYFPKFLLGACMAFMIRNSNISSETLSNLTV